MKISEVKIFPFAPGDTQKNLKAYDPITLDDALVIKGIKVFEKKMAVYLLPTQPFKAGIKLITISSFSNQVNLNQGFGMRWLRPIKKQRGA